MITEGGYVVPSLYLTANLEDVPEKTLKHVRTSTRGLSVRDYFAAQALIGLVARIESTSESAEALSEHAYALADALLEARDRGRS